MTDERSLKFYVENAVQAYRLYEGLESPTQYYAEYLPDAGRILDVGAGSGRDLLKLLESGFDAYGIEPCEAFRSIAIKHYPQLRGRLLDGALPIRGMLESEKYDAIILQAVLEHVEESRILECLVSVCSLLDKGGRVILSVSNNRPNLDDESRDNTGRLFEQHPVSKLKLIFSRLGFSLLSSFVAPDALGRGSMQWNYLIFERGELERRPLDQIESVLRKDRKTASYKLALLRAFCDLSQMSESALDWSVGGYVGVPLDRVVDKWLHYYWPLVDTGFVIPQIKGEISNRKTFAFKPLLKELQEAAAKEFIGGDSFTCFVADSQANSLSPDLKAIDKKLRAKIRRAIIEGPIKHSDSGVMFSLSSNRNSILVKADLWQEFCLTGYWIRDSLLLRWAELSCEFAGVTTGGVDLAAVLRQLLISPNVQRNQNIVRTSYLAKPDLKCVWSDKKLSGATLHIDHALPFSIYRNNELWNLVPSHKDVNLQKRDSIPDPKTIAVRADCLIDNWRYIRSKNEHGFEASLENILGHGAMLNWERNLLSHLAECASQAIYYRGASPWRSC